MDTFSQSILQADREIIPEGLLFCRSCGMPIKKGVTPQAYELADHRETFMPLCGLCFDNSEQRLPTDTPNQSGNQDRSGSE